MIEHWEDMFKRLGPSASRCAEILFCGKRFIFTAEPEHIKAVLATKFDKFGKGPVFHRQWEAFLGDGIFTVNGHMWQNSRGLLRPMFVNTRVRDFDIFECQTAHFMSKLPPSGQTVDLCDLFYRLTLDVTTDFLMGRSVGSLRR